MKTLNIVLLEPRIPENAGNIARTCAVTGARLHLIRPFGFEITDKHLKRAGLDYWHLLDISYYDDLEDFYAKNSGPCFYFTSKGPRRHTEAEYPDNCYLFFGREDAGLPEELLLKKPAKLCAHAHAAGGSLPESEQRRGSGCLRGAAPVEL